MATVLTPDTEHRETRPEGPRREELPCAEPCSVVLRGLDWQRYTQLLELCDGQRLLRINYQRGTAEMMLISSRHERWKKVAARVIETLCQVWQIELACAGSFTCRRESSESGLEPGECWYIQHEAAVRGKFDLDLERDPPPDLILEVETSRTIVDRLQLLARLGVPEVWRFDGREFTALSLIAGEYQSIEHSLALPRLRVADLNPWLSRFEQESESAVLRDLEVWALARPPAV